MHESKTDSMFGQLEKQTNSHIYGWHKEQDAHMSQKKTQKHECGKTVRTCEK